MNIKLALTILVVYCVIQIDALPKFIRGKFFNKLKSYGLTSFPDQYYDQRLDHFDEANILTWKQVILVLRGVIY